MSAKDTLTERTLPATTALAVVPFPRAARYSSRADSDVPRAFGELDRASKRENGCIRAAALHTSQRTVSSNAREGRTFPTMAILATVTFLRVVRYVNSTRFDGFHTTGDFERTVEG